MSLCPSETVLAIHPAPSGLSLLFNLDDEASYQLTPGQQEQIKLLRSSTSVKCVVNAGESRSGKSTLLNAFLSVATGQENIHMPTTFQTSSDPETCTVGIQFTVTGTMGGEVIVIIDTGGLYNGEGNSKTLDVMLGIAFATSNSHVSMSACNLRNPAFAAASRVAAAGVIGAAGVRVQDDGPVPTRTLVMVANQWSAAVGTAPAYFQRQLELRDDPVHAAEVQVFQVLPILLCNITLRLYWAHMVVKILLSKIRMFGDHVSTRAKLQDCSSPESMEVVAVAKRIIASIRPMTLGGQPVDGAGFLGFLKALVEAGNATLQEDNGVLRVPSAVTAIQSSCANAKAAAENQYNDKFAWKQLLSEYMNADAFDVFDAEAHQSALGLFATHTDRWRALLPTEVDFYRDLLVARLNALKIEAEKANRDIGLEPSGPPWTEVRHLQIASGRKMTSEWDGGRKRETADYQTIQRQERQVVKLKNGDLSPAGPEVGWVAISSHDHITAEYRNGGGCFKTHPGYPNLGVVSIKA